jgi:hypothetical protein
LLSAVIATVQAPWPAQAPLHPAKTKPVAAVAESCNAVPESKAAEQVPGQEMPGGAVVTVPLPITATESVGRPSTTFVNFASTVSFSPMRNAHGPEPVHVPLQPANAEPLSAVAVSCTAVPGSNVAEHVPGHAIPGGMDVTRPDPDMFTDRLAPGDGGISANVAATAMS